MPHVPYSDVWRRHRGVPHPVRDLERNRHLAHLAAPAVRGPAGRAVRAGARTGYLSAHLDPGHHAHALGHAEAWPAHGGRPPDLARPDGPADLVAVPLRPT